MPVQSSLDSWLPGAAQASPPRPVAQQAARPRARQQPSGEPKESKRPGRPATKCLTSSDPPINDIQAMFSDLVSRLPQFRDVAERLAPRKLRVATMCSGTESPLLALGMISRAVEKLWGVKFETEHIFSCEIEPFKQAYIERNFSPPVLFRDVCELGNPQATTAYGALVDVPGNADMLVAGTSCVDYSSLNNQKQDITAKGESGETFRGMMSWVKKNRPPIVILENVCSAPWDAICEYFDTEGYAAIHTRVDTKKFYIPHTRTRGYLVAFDTRRVPEGKKKIVEAFPKKWKERLLALQRPASCPFDQFLLPSDDPRIHAAREKLVKESAEGNSRREKIDWGKCESRHQKARLGEELGTKRPFTQWEEGGQCHMLAWTWHDWARTQVERVWDLLDVTVLRHAQLGIDPSYKTIFWNLSQNVDRSISDTFIGICPCLTPSMIPYVTTRGGPITGLEALGLQGLPVNELLLTTETEDNLIDLAGNAMTTTVIGATMMSALVVALSILDPGEGEMEVDSIEDESVEKHIKGEDQLTERPLNLAPLTSTDLTAVLEHAGHSARKCICEGRTGVTPRPLLRCLDCGFTSCDKCAGRPTHNNVSLEESRIDPASFERELKATLPMCVRFLAVTEQDLEEAFSSRGGKLKKSIWLGWKKAALKAVGGILRFAALKRQEIWVVRYESVDAVLTLSLDPTTKPEWALFAKPDISEPANSAMRELLTTTPVLRSVGNTSFLDGSWQWGIPTLTEFPLRLCGKGDLVPSWQATLGLQGKFNHMKVWSCIEIEVPEDNVDELEFDISGEYRLYQHCGTATNALHKRVTPTPDGKDLFFFFDPSLEKELEKDAFVFSTSIRQYDQGEARPVISRLDPKWRQRSKDDSEEVACTAKCQWIEAEDLKLMADTESEAMCAVPTKPLDVDVSLGHCATANAVLTCRVPLPDVNPSAVWPKEHWSEVDSVHERTVFQALAWFTQRVTSIKAMAEWQAITVDGTRLHDCNICAPSAPAIKWARKGSTSKMIAFEDIGQAGQYEQALKNRPAPFVTQLRLKDQVGELRIGINFASLIHRALSRLPIEGRTEQPCLTWRLTTDYTPPAVLNLPKFILGSNRQDAEHAQPANFVVTLRPEQRRSLTWMLEQESVSARPFVEEEVAEAVLEPLGWRAEGQATRTVQVRGGVLADQVGYGKTAITLGLIDAASGQKKPDLPEFLTKGRIRAGKTTLIVVPPHLVRQWPSEVEKFLGDHYDIITIASLKQLSNFKISDIRNAKIVIVASTLFKSDAYLQNLSNFAGVESLANCDGRMFNMRLDEAIASAGEHIELLKKKGPEAVWEKIKENHEKLEKAEEAFVQSKRLKGRQYRESKANPKKRQIVEDEDSNEAGDRRDNSDAPDTEDCEPPIKKQKKELTDPWDLRSAGVRKDWMKMSCPPLECFLFERVVVDEYTYLEGKILALVCKIKSLYRWVLSGTPPVHDFAAVKTIAVLLDIHLGIDDYSETRTADARRRQKERTAAEKFHSFREVNSLAWHARRHDVAQRFLDQFVRQNVAEIDEIPSEQILRPITLPAAERAIYLELEHHLLALDMTIKKSRKGESDRDKRLAQSLGESKSAEEALLKRCAHFDLDMDGVSLNLVDKKGKSGGSSKNGMKENAMRACDVIVNERERQLEECKAELLEKLSYAVELENRIGKTEEQSPFRGWVEVCKTKGVGDKEATSLILDLNREAIPSTPVDANGQPIEPKKAAKQEKSAKPEKSSKPKKTTKAKVNPQKGEADDSSDTEPQGPEELIWSLREHTHVIRRLEKELTSRVRSLRYFSNVRLLQQSDVRQQLEGGEMAVYCPTCPDGSEALPINCISILSSCGHMGCEKCVRAHARREECVYTSQGCTAAARELNIVHASSLGIDESRDRTRKHYGMKLEKIMDLIQNGIPKKERVLIFVQFPDLTQKVAEALEEHKIEFTQIAGTAIQQSKSLETFQDPEATQRVLLLNVMDEKASGANLTVANHAIFISPLLTPTKEIYVANETQAIGRVLRYGQTKKVHIWRFLTLDTIDVTIYEERSGSKVDRSVDATVLQAGSLVDPRVASRETPMEDDTSSSTASVEQSTGSPNSAKRWVADYVEVPSRARSQS